MIILNKGNENKGRKQISGKDTSKKRFGNLLSVVEERH
jgi:hypothetical protein